MGTRSRSSGGTDPSAWSIAYPGMVAGSPGGKGINPRKIQRRQQRIQRGMHLHLDEFVIVEPRPLQAGVIQLETQWLDNVEQRLLQEHFR